MSVKVTRELFEFRAFESRLGPSSVLDICSTVFANGQQHFSATNDAICTNDIKLAPRKSPKMPPI